MKVFRFFLFLKGTNERASLSGTEHLSGIVRRVSPDAIAFVPVGDARGKKRGLRFPQPQPSINKPRFGRTFGRLNNMMIHKLRIYCHENDVRELTVGQVAVS